MNLQPQEAGEEVEASLHGRIAFPFLECNTVRRERVDYISIGIREVAVRIRMQKRNKRFSAGPAIRARTDEQRRNFRRAKTDERWTKPNKRFKDLATDSYTHKE